MALSRHGTHSHGALAANVARDVRARGERGARDDICAGERARARRRGGGARERAECARSRGARGDSGGG